MVPNPAHLNAISKAPNVTGKEPIIISEWALIILDRLHGFLSEKPDSDSAHGKGP